MYSKTFDTKAIKKKTEKLYIIWLTPGVLSPIKLLSLKEFLLKQKYHLFYLKH